MELVLLALAAGAAWISYRVGLDAGRASVLSAQRETIGAALSTQNDFYRNFGMHGCYLLDGHEYSSPSGFVVVSLNDLRERIQVLPGGGDAEDSEELSGAGVVSIEPRQSSEPCLLPSRALAGIVGTEPLTATEATKKVWEYIVSNGLQDSTQATLVRCDANLQAFTGKGTVTMFELTKAIRSNLASSEA